MIPPSSNSHDSWSKFLDPDQLKKNLLVGGLYLAAFELLKSSLVGRPRDFYWDGIRDGKDVISEEYEKKVLSRHKHSYTASAMWWREYGAIDDDDVTLLQKIRGHRDMIAHNMPKILGTADHGVDMELLEGCHSLLTKIDNWWIINIELDTNPDGSEYTEEEKAGACSMSAFFLGLMLPIASGDDQRLRDLHEAWVAHQRDVE